MLDEECVRVGGVVEVGREQDDVEALAVVHQRDFGLGWGGVEEDAAAGPGGEESHGCEDGGGDVG